MKCMLFLVVLFVCGIVVFVVLMLVGNLIVNGGFESSIVVNGSWVNIVSLLGWIWLGGLGMGFEVCNNVVGSVQEGCNYVELDINGNMIIGQYFDNFSVGVCYDLSFWYVLCEQQVVLINGIEVYWNGVQFGSMLIGLGGSQNDWNQYEYLVMVQFGCNLLSFVLVGCSDSFGGNFDNVGFYSVFELGSFVLVLVVLGGLFMLFWWLCCCVEMCCVVVLVSMLVCG